MIGDIDGLEALALLKSDPRTKDIPVMMLTNFTSPEKLQKAIALGAVDYISLQSQSIQKIPMIYRNYLENPEGYEPFHPAMRAR
jgi:CheY-like chemotaxis protein